MQARNLLNLILLLAVIGLAVAAWFVYQDKTKINYLSSLDTSQVTRIVIPREHHNIMLTKQDSLWLMEQPFNLPAHDFRVKTLLGLLQTPVNQSYAADKLDLAQLGLKPAQAKIQFNELEIQFGYSNPVNNKRYLLSNGRVYLLDDTLFPLVSAEAASLVNLSLLPSDVSVVRLSLPHQVIQKDADNIWHDATGKTIAADTVQQLLDNWRDASAFAAHAYMKRPDATPVTLELNNKTSLHFLAIENGNWLILGRPDAGIEYHLDIQNRNKLLQLPDTKPAAP